jgi:hypothetical protein
MLDLVYVNDIVEVEDTEEDCFDRAKGIIDTFAKAAVEAIRSRSWFKSTIQSMPRIPKASLFLE